MRSLARVARLHRPVLVAAIIGLAAQAPAAPASDWPQDPAGRTVPASAWGWTAGAELEPGGQLEAASPNRLSTRVSTRNLRGVALVFRARGCPSFATLRIDGAVVKRFRIPKRARSVEAGVDEPPGEHELAIRLRPRHPRRHLQPTVTLARTYLREWVPIGAAVYTRYLDSDPALRQLVADNFDFVVPENDMKMDVLQPEQGSFDFVSGDRIVDYAETNGLDFGMGHVLVWHHQIPGWLWLADPECPWRDENSLLFGRPPITRSELIDVMRRHITEVVRHYSGSVTEWDVVNEAIANDGDYRENIWYRVIGPEYIELAFRFAHEADPDAALYYNDYGTEVAGSAHTEAVYRMLSRLRDAGAPVDGVGFQFHLFPQSRDDVPTAAAIEENFARFAALGLRLQVTELDISLKALGADGAYEWQGAQYEKVARACIAEPACERFTTWGASDRYSWLQAASYGLPFDAGLRPKPAWAAITEILRPTP